MTETEPETFIGLTARGGVELLRLVPDATGAWPQRLRTVREQAARVIVTGCAVRDDLISPHHCTWRDWIRIELAHGGEAVTIYAEEGAAGQLDADLLVGAWWWCTGTTP